MAQISCNSGRHDTYQQKDSTCLNGELPINVKKAIGWRVNELGRGVLAQLSVS